jgi:hypothetical protein
MRVSDYKKLNLVASSSSLEGISKLAKEYLLTDVDLDKDGDGFRVTKQGKDVGLIVKLIGKRWQMRWNK